MDSEKKILKVRRKYDIYLHVMSQVLIDISKKYTNENVLKIPIHQVFSNYKANLLSNFVVIFSYVELNRKQSLMKKIISMGGKV